MRRIISNSCYFYGNGREKDDDDDEGDTDRNSLSSSLVLVGHEMLPAAVPHDDDAAVSLRVRRVKSGFGFAIVVGGVVKCFVCF